MKGGKIIHNFNPKRSALFSLLYWANLIAGCIFAVPLVVSCLATDGYVATAYAGKNADEIWQAITRLAEKCEAEDRIEVKETLTPLDRVLTVFLQSEHFELI